MDIFEQPADPAVSELFTKLPTFAKLPSVIYRLWL